MSDVTFELVDQAGTDVAFDLVAEAGTDLTFELLPGGAGTGGVTLPISSDDVDVEGTALTLSEWIAGPTVDVTIPVTPFADVGTTKPTILLHLHDQDGGLVDHFAGAIDFGGGVVIKSTGTLTRRTGVDGEPTDIWLVEFYSFGGTAFRRTFAEVTSTDPGEIPWLGDIVAAVNVPIRVANPTEASDAATKAYVDTLIGTEATTRGDADDVLFERVIITGATPPDEPDVPGTATWVRTVGNLRSFVDFRLFPDGPVDEVPTNGVGSVDPVQVRSFASLGYPFQPALVDAGAVVSDQTTEATESDPTPRTGFTIYDGENPIPPNDVGRIEWGHGGIVEGNGDLEDYIPTNVAISDPDGNAYLMGVVLGRFDTGLNTTDPGNPVSARMRLIRDDLAAPTTIGSAALPRLPAKGDRFALTWDTDGNLAGHMNGVEIVAVTETTHDISTFDRIGMPMHQGSDDVAWNDGYYTRVEWFGISGGDEITGNLGSHQWTDDGWQPAGPQARPVLGSGGGGAVDSVNGQTGTVVLDADDISDGTTNKAYTATEKTKLAGIATGATATETWAVNINCTTNPHATVGTTPTVAADSGSIGGGYLSSANATGSGATFKRYLSAGTYDIKLRARNLGVSSGRGEVLIDGVSKGYFDTSVSSARNVEHTVATGVTLTAGVHEITVASYDKGTGATSWTVFVQTIDLIRTA